MSIGAISFAILLSYKIPNTVVVSDFTTSFSALRSWLQPPYLYFIINAIIITIVASSRFHHNHHAPPSKDTSSPHLPPQIHHQHDVISVRSDQFSPYGIVSHVAEAVGGIRGFEYNDVVSVKDVIEEEEVVVKKINDESMVAEKSMWTPPPRSKPLIRQEAFEKVSPEFLSAKPPATSRFGHHHRRPAKANTHVEGGSKALKVLKPKKQDTLESTWKAITEGRHIPLNRHLKKSDTWEHQDRQIDLLNDPSPFPTAVKKSETLHEQRTNYVSPPVTSTKLKKEPSLSQDELNRRVEAFIHKFNEDMRLQRQQSMQQFMEMINRAV
ncbi:unnamed protein product [Amaranthus hypochondriacus]